MKKFLIAALLSATLTATAQQTEVKEVVPTNRYAMKLSKNADGSYSLINSDRIAKLIDLNKVPDLLVPYTYERDRLNSRDYKGVEVREFVYKTHEGYELKMAVDMAVSEKPTPAIIYIHGGGWARGDNGSARTLSQYLAKQKGITGVRITYTLAPQPGADVRVSIADVKDAVQYLRDHAEELNIDPSRLGFYGSSAGAHLAAVGAMTTPEAKAFVGNAGIYDLETANICQKTKDRQRIAYFCDRDSKVLRNASPVNLIPKKDVPAALLFCGTGDTTVEYTQSEEFARALKRRGGKVDLQIYPYYSHNLNNKASDKMEEIFFKTVDFFAANLQ
ncbi:alpha/beta hydrolase [uncultured Alistipes sp.]|uniref:alpha/beta hydrolase n=1 Tax=uncultured Alistipes sp. TaxID=538949 RepID=UPI0025F25183|nr:alpha/beta hydrolase [uncultured Alistipes sp.]